MKRLSFLAAVSLSAVMATATPKGEKPGSAPSDMDTFITELMSKMTVEEKIGQLNLPVTGEIVTGQAKSSDVAKLIEQGLVGGLFNLKGEGNGTILDHVVTLNASHITPVDSVLIPTGEIAPVEGTPFDFRTPHAIGERIGSKFEQLVLGAGYDHCYVLNKTERGFLDLAATCKDPKSGRTMEVYTTEEGVQLYTGNWLNGFTGAHGATYPERSAVCFEAQCFPDTPNQMHFPAATLLPGDEYQQTTVYKFGVE